MNNDLNIIYNWLIANSLRVNIDKTEYIKFPKGSLNYSCANNVDSIPIKEVNVVKYLGVYYDS